MNANKPFFEQSLLKKYIEEKMEHKELLKVLYMEWKKAKNEELFLILLGYTWLFMENVYLDDVFQFYNERIYEKELLLILLKYGEKNMRKNVKYWLLTGYIVRQGIIFGEI